MPLTKRILSGVVLLLYLYNLAGYIGLFLFIRGSIRDEVAGKIRSELSGEEYVILIFHTRSMESGACNLRWIDDQEFRFNGNMYDVISRQTRGDSTVLNCLTDEKEDRLYVGMEQHVESQTDQSKSRGSLASMKIVVQDCLPLQPATEVFVHEVDFRPVLISDYYESVILEISPPPPKQFLIG